MASEEKNSYKYKGTALIISIAKFDGEAKIRHGASRDLRMMKELFVMLDFKVKAYKDLKAEEILKKIDKAKNWSEIYDPEYFVFVISTHGGELEMKKTQTIKPAVFGKDGVSISIDDITSRFLKKENDEIHRFDGKPKYFFIQEYSMAEYLVPKGFKVIFTILHQSIQSSRSGSLRENAFRRNFETACRNREKGKKEDGYDRGVKLDVNKLIEKMMRKKARGSNKDDVDKQENASLEESGSDFTDDVQEPDLLKNFWYNDDKSDDEWDGTETDDDDEEDDNDNEDDDIDVGDGTDPDDIGRVDSKNKPSDSGDARFKLGGDEEDAKIPPAKKPPEIHFEAAHCPEDCLIMQPAMPGKYAWRNKTLGSYMLYYMHLNKTMLLEGWPFLQFLTKVCHDVAERDIYPTDEDIKNKTPVKMCIIITSRLKDDIVFESQEDTFFTRVRKTWLRSTNKLILSESKDLPKPGPEFVY